MCGRFMLISDEDDVRIRFNISIYNEIFRRRYNCAPSQNLALISMRKPEKLDFFKWGYAISKNSSIKPINVRAESIYDKALFRKGLNGFRCLIPANGYYEWMKENKQKQPYLIGFKNMELFAMGGICSESMDDDGNIIRSFAIITTEACGQAASVHSRMPLILSREEEEMWLRDNTDHKSLLNLLKPHHHDLEVRAVSKAVNSVSNDSPEILQKPPPKLF